MPATRGALWFFGSMGFFFYRKISPPPTCSSIKFTLITIAIVYVVWGLVWRAVTATRVKLTST